MCIRVLLLQCFQVAPRAGSCSCHSGMHCVPLYHCVLAPSPSAYHCVPGSWWSLKCALGFLLNFAPMCCVPCLYAVNPLCPVVLHGPLTGCASLEAKLPHFQWLQHWACFRRPRAHFIVTHILHGYVVTCSVSAGSQHVLFGSLGCGPLITCFRGDDGLPVHVSPASATIPLFWVSKMRGHTCTGACSRGCQSKECVQGPTFAAPFNNQWVCAVGKL